MSNVSGTVKSNIGVRVPDFTLQSFVNRLLLLYVR